MTDSTGDGVAPPSLLRFGRDCRPFSPAQTGNSCVCVVREGHPTIRDTLTLKQYRQARHVMVNTHLSTAAGHAEQIARAVRNAHCLALPAIIMSTDLVATVPRGLAVSFLEDVKLRLFPPPFAMPGFEARLY